MLNKKSEEKLVGVNDKLIKIARRASETCEVEFIVTEGLRTVARQKELVAKGASKTMQSKHIVGRAFDVAPVIGGQVRWDWPPFHTIAAAMKKAAKDLGIVIVWGGDWKTFPDGPHFELGEKE